MVELIALMVTVGALLYHHVYDGFSLLILIAISFICFGWFVFRTYKAILFYMVLSSSLLLGATTFWVKTPVIPEQLFGSRAFDATIVSVDRQIDKTNIIVRESITKKLLRLSLYEEVPYLPGDIVAVQATVEYPESFITDTGRVFDYPHYLKSKNIVGIAQRPIVSLQTEGDVSVSRIATTVRFLISDTLAQNISFPVDGIISGMTVGYQGSIPQDIKELFRDTGVLHLLVLSGYNITLLASFLGIVLKFLPFQIRTIISIIAIFILVVISGSGIASVRAGIMGGIALFAGLAVRTYQPLRALVLAYLFFFFISPTTILYDPGFHLSFLATTYMVLIFPKIMKWFHPLQSSLKTMFRELFALSISIPIFILPYIMYFSGEFPLSSPIANMAFGIIAPLLMILGVVVLLFWWIPPFALFIGGISSSIGEFSLLLLEKLSTVYVWQTPSIPWWGVVLVYSFFMGFFFRKEIKRFLLRLQNLLLPVSSSFDS